MPSFTALARIVSLCRGLGRRPHPGTPPMVVSVTLSRGALRMAAHKVIVKRLGRDPEPGSMDVLCTDKTGT